MDGGYWSSERFDAEAQRLYEAGDYEGALRLLAEGLERHPASPELRVSEGYCHAAREEFGWARGAFEAVLALAPDHEDALAGLGEVLLRLGERASAFLAFERVLELGFADDAELTLHIGRALAREGLEERAERFLALAQEADPAAAEATLELAFLRYRGGDAAGARRACERALRRDPSLAEARVLRAHLCYEAGEYTAALEALEGVSPAQVWDPVAAWRAVELLRRVRGLPAASSRLAPWMKRLEALTPEPSPEERLLAEVEAAHGGGPLPVGPDRSQLELFGWSPPPGDGVEAHHRVRAPDGRVYEGDWEGIVRAMRDRSENPSASVAEFMQQESERLRHLTGIPIPWDDPRAFIRESVRAGVLRLER